MSLNCKLLPDNGYERLEPDVAKVASPVLRRGRASNRSFLFGKVARSVLRGLEVGNDLRLLDSAELGKSVSREFGAVIRERKDQGENEGCKQMRLLDLK